MPETRFTQVWFTLQGLLNQIQSGADRVVEPQMPKSVEQADPRTVLAPSSHITCGSSGFRVGNRRS